MPLAGHISARRRSVYVTVDSRVVAFIAILIALVWAASALADAAMRTFEVSAGVQAVMMSMSGALFGSLLRRTGNDKEDDDSDRQVTQ